MSVFTPVNVEAPFDRKKQLVQKLMEQLGQNVQRGASLMGRTDQGGMVARGAFGTGFRPSHPFGGTQQLTQAPPGIGSALRRLLGPGGFGLPIPGVESSMAPGQSILSRLGASPHAPAPINRPGSLGMPMNLAGASPAASAMSPAQNAVVTGPGPAPVGANSISTPGNAPLVDPGFLTSNSSAIPLGNGLFYDPTTKQIVTSQQLSGPSTAGLAAPGPGRTTAV